MNYTGWLTMIIATGLLVACSKTELQANTGNSSSMAVPPAVLPAAQAPDYKLICERLSTLGPEDRKAAMAGKCEAEYQRMLPACRNVAAVNDCYANLKSWSTNLACLDSCIRQ